jgi:predicted phosphodiesterase
VRLVIASDTHGLHGEIVVPGGDVLIHCGDFTGQEHDEATEIDLFAAWLRALPHRRKVVVAGNHDFGFEREPEAFVARLGPGVDYLLDSGVEIDGVRFWGSPWQPEYGRFAFNLPRGAPLARKWNLLPDDIDVLVTHGPPATILDRSGAGQHVGDSDLWKRVRELRPRVHCFGHVHDSSGVEERDGTIFVNAAICDRQYWPTNPVRVVDI